MSRGLLPTGFGEHGMNTAPISAILLAMSLGPSNAFLFLRKFQGNGMDGCFMAEAQYT